MTLPAVSLIVATVGRTVELGQFLDSLATQTFRSFEVIVVDQNSDDRLLPYLVSARKAGFDVKHFKHHPANLSTARNVGIHMARGGWVGFPDDDCVYDAALLARLAPHFTRTDPLSGASARWTEVVDPALGPGKLTWARSRLFRDVPVASFTLFFNRRLFERIGGFDPRLGVGRWFGAGEETDLVLRALRVGAVIDYEPLAKVHHPLKRSPPTAQARFAARLRARGAGALYAKHNLPPWVVLRGLAAPVLRPLLKGTLGAELGEGYAVMRGRLEGVLRWERIPATSNTEQFYYDTQ